MWVMMDNEVVARESMWFDDVVDLLTFLVENPLWTLAYVID